MIQKNSAMGLLSRPRAWLLALTLLAGLGCQRSAETPRLKNVVDVPPSGKGFTDITDAAGVRNPHQKPQLDRKIENIMPWMASVGAAAAAADYDDDGDIDLYVTNSRLKSPNRLYRNNGDGTFTDVAKDAGVAHANESLGASMDAVFGDIDNDGHMDLYVVKWGKNILYRNNGDNTFTDVTDAAGVGDRGNGNGAVFFDYDDDTDLDLYIGNYFRYDDLWNLNDTRIMHGDFEVARDGGPNVLYRNDGNGTFTNVSEALGVADTGWALDVGVADYDNDGDMDLFVANDFGQDKAFRNNGDGSFTDVTDDALGWDTHKGMNIDFGDFNNDGWLDLYVSNIWTEEYVQEGNSLFRNMGNGSFSNIAFETQTYDGGWSWGAKFWDLDNDGDLDIMNANGFVSANPEKNWWADLAISVTKPDFDPMEAKQWPPMEDKTLCGYEPSRVWVNQGNETFKEMAAALGLGDNRDGRGLAIFDCDNDGDLDVFISNQGQDSVLYRNDQGNRNNWLEFRLKGTVSNRNAIGARVTVATGDLTQIREVDGGNANHCQSSFRVHFGIGPHTSVDRVEVRWPCGFVQKVEGVRPNRIVSVTEATTPEYLEERRRWKESELAARKEKKAPEAKAEAVDWDELREFKREYLEKTKVVEESPRDPKGRFELGLLLDKGGRKDSALRELERAIELDPDNLTYGNEYRRLIRRYGHLHFDRSIRFFERLVEKHPDCIMARLNKSLSYVDKMPYPKLGVVSQGRLSNKSIAELDEVLKRDPECWAAQYIRAMNHLHWPRKLKHAPLAVRDFRTLIELGNALGPDKQRDYFAYGYVGLGDAYVKNRDEGREEMIKKAREIWREGIARYPSSEDLKTRLELGDDEVIGYIKKLRGLEDPVNTDLSLIWVESGSQPRSGS